MKPNAPLRTTSLAVPLLAAPLLSGCGDTGDATTTRAVQAWASSTPAGAGDRHIVMLRRGASASAVARQHGLSPTSLFSRAIQGFAADVPASALSALRRNPNVISVTPVRTVEAFAQQASTGLRRIGGPAPGAVAVGIAVLDTGIAVGHRDLNVVRHVDCSSGSRWATSCIEDAGDDIHGHGTHVAGVAAAIDNDVDVVGVAAGAPLHAVKVLDDSGRGSTETVIRGLDWVASHAASIRVANLSLGGACTRGPWLVPCDDAPCASTTDPEHAAVCNLVAAGVAVVAAAGNSQRDVRFYSPAAYAEAITVSALADFDGAPGGLGTGSFAFSSCTEDRDDSFACFSNFGAGVDIMAPGVGILSTTPGGLEAWSGTSMAAPFVAGAAARVIAESPGATPADVRATLLAAAEPEPCADRTASGACSDDPDGIGEPLVRMQGEPCGSDADCDDGDACTIDSCDPATGSCHHEPLDCDDGDACTVDSCDPVAGCLYENVCQCGGNRAPCSSDADCCSGNCRRGTCRGN